MIMSVQTIERRNSVSQAIAEITAILEDRISIAQTVRDQHGKDTTWNPGHSPDAVAFVNNTEEVQKVVQICSKYEIPVIPYGTGTSLEGHITCPYGGVSLDLNNMNQVLEVNPQDFDVTVQPGVTRKQLNEYIRDQGLFFPIDPGADASLGGMTATRASGTNAVRYGTMRENVMSLTAVMANGEIVRTARRAKKSAAGYDLTRLMVGSEGTLGVITEICLKLHGIPESIAAGVCPFPSVKSACDAAIACIQMGVPIARVELMDSENLKALNTYSNLKLKEVPTLFVEFHGTETGTREQIDTFSFIAEELGGGPFDWATKEEDRGKLWQARHDSYWAIKAQVPGKESLGTDVCVPISKLAECVEETRLDLEKHGLYGPILGHVGDGNFHVVLFCDRDDPVEVRATEEFLDRLAMRSIAMDGTCTGEHGIGSGKRKFLEAELGSGVAVMRSIKQALDPKNIMNPGKIIP